MDSNKAIFTVPNLLSFLRLPLIALFAWFYEMHTTQGTLLAVLMLALSALSDLLDGKIARKFHCISNLGKFLDPFADKVTQLVLILCLLGNNNSGWGNLVVVLLVLFLAKEISQLIGGLIIIRGKGEHHSSFLWGKVNTALLYAAMALLLFIPAMPEALFTAIVCVCIISIVSTFLLYLREFLLIMGKAQA